jgi:hypothetical protein
MPSKKSARKAAPKKAAAPKRAPAKKSAPMKRGAAASKKPAPRKDFGAPIDPFFAKQPAPVRAILDPLRALIEAEAPDADASIKWGNPFFTLRGEMMLAISAHKAHVNLILAGPPGTYRDPKGLLEGEGKTGKHLKLLVGQPVPTADARGFIQTAVARARKAAP